MIDDSIIGKRFGKLVVISFHHSNKYKMTYWLCKCDCGNEKVISRGGLTSGDNVSCGCYHKEHAHEYGKMHGLSRTKLYSVWSGMIQRCTNAKAQNYDRYGARGISVCDEWRNDFKSFYDLAIGSGYLMGLQLTGLTQTEITNLQIADGQTELHSRITEEKITISLTAA